MIQNISIVICCYNSEAVLTPTLEALSRQSLAKERFEVIAVDNNCTDRSMEIVQRLLTPGGISYRIVQEPVAGLMHARRTGVRHAHNDLLLFVDDDNILADDYLEKLLAIYRRNPLVGVAGSRVEPLVADDTPEWFEQFGGVYACGEQAPDSQDVTYGRMTLFGAGLSFRRELIHGIFFDDPELFLTGRTGNLLLRGDDSELCMRAILRGWRVWYDKGLLLQHNILPCRIHWSYVEQARFGGGAASIILERYRAVILERPVHSFLSDLIRSLRDYVKLALRRCLNRSDAPGSTEAFHYWFLKGRLYGLFTYGPRRISVITQQIKHLKHERRP